MTLVLAFVGTDGIVVAADSQAFRSGGEGEAYYPSNWEKIVELGNGCLVGIANDAGVATQLLDYARSRGVDFNHRTRFQEVVWKFRESFLQGYKQIYNDSPPKELQAEWVFCGYGPEGGQKVPSAPSRSEEVSSCPSRGAIGRPLVLATTVGLTMPAATTVLK